ncbi:chemotaxis-specific protein-glutamate methyltransferase CheB [Baaleninema sp.]|uniref:chemotaxis-specific protein-glutamate methyltransferase CheB n=1 Tax=Baaleninema sp. TaxID=3101197 RepID=UPI003D08CD25
MPIRVLVAEDSPVVQIVLKRLFSGCSDIELVAMARTGKEALDLLPRVKPDVVCTDLHMPEMNGLELTEEIMSTMPLPILVLSASVQAEDTQNVFRVLNAGAVDVLPKPIDSSVGNWDDLKQELLTKIRVLSGVAVFTHRRRTASVTKTPTVTREERLRSYQVLAVGASTGGPQALLSILSTIPKNFPVPIVCVQHISRGFLQGLVAWLNSETHITVEIASAGSIAKPGTAYFPPEDKHLIFDRPGRFAYSDVPPLSGHRPSVTVLFESVARCYGRRAVGVLLTGMGKDGATGMLEIERAGGLTVAQDEASSVVFGMPKEAIALGAAHYVLPLNEISPMLLEKVFR